VATALIASALDAGAESVVASCADGSVIFAGRWTDVGCAGAARMPPGQVARVGSEPDRTRALAWEREAARERDLEASLAEVIGPPRRSAPPGPGGRPDREPQRP
jgi:hypothetical protein